MKKSHLIIGLLGLVAFAWTGQRLTAHLMVAVRGEEVLRMMTRADHVYLFIAALLNVVLGMYFVEWGPGWGRTLQRIGSAMILASPFCFFCAFLGDTSNSMLDPRQFAYPMGEVALLFRERPLTLLASFLVSTGAFLQFIAFSAGGSRTGRRFRETKGLQNVLTVLVDVDAAPGKLKALRKLLKQGISFPERSDLHMATLVLFDHDPAGSADFKPFMVFTSYFDGPLEAFLDSLWELSGARFESIYSLCPDYPGGGFGGKKGFRDFLLDHSVRYNTFYSAYPGVTLKTIRENQRLREGLQEALDARIPPEELPQRGRSLMPSPMRLPRPDFFCVFLRAAVRCRVLVLPVLALGLVALLVRSPGARSVAGALVALNLLFLLVLLFHEGTEVCPEESPIQVGRFPGVPQKARGQNQTVMLLTIKPGLFRRVLFKGILALWEFVARNYYVRGDLGGISSIHLLHFTLVDGGRRMLFFSQYDGSLENYLSDFVERDSPRLSFFGSSTAGFPRTWALFFGGAKNEPVLRDWILRNRVGASFFYSAHDGQSTFEILKDLEIRKGVDRGVTGHDADVWLGRL